MQLPLFAEVATHYVSVINDFPFGFWFGFQSGKRAHLLRGNACECGGKSKWLLVTLLTKVRLVKAKVFPGAMCGCESWTIKKAEHRRIVTLLRSLLRVPCTARRSNQSILKEISPEYSLEGLRLKLKLQCFGHLMTHWKSPWCWERLRAGGEGGDRGWDGWMASPTQWTWLWVNSGSWWWTGRPGVLQSMGLQRVGHDRANGLQSLWVLVECRDSRSTDVEEGTEPPCLSFPICLLVS